MAVSRRDRSRSRYGYATLRLMILRICAAFLACFLACVDSPPASADPRSEPLLLVTDPAALQTAEAAGVGFARWFSQDERPPGGEGMVPNDRLAREPAWQSLVEPLRASIARIEMADPRAGVGVARNPHRLFDLRWLESATAFFELVGVVNRLDRRPFQDGACGETRLVYRLAYRDGTMRSRLPMTVAVELRGDPRDGDRSCRAAASLWRAPQHSDGAALGRWLVSPDGPLAPERLSRARLVQIAVNLQSVRWPSGVKPDLGGHAEYLLRAFAWLPGPGRYGEGRLENTPDLARLKHDAGLRAELLAFLRRPESRAALDEGSLRLPSRFLAREAVSVAPLGSGRLANRPFSQLFDPGEFSALEGSRTLQTPAALLRRLDDLTCQGCHQSRSVAGFHLLGTDGAGATRTGSAGNALALPGSPHLQNELVRRAVYAAASLTEPEPNPFRPLAGAGRMAGGFGEPCMLGGAVGVAWGCKTAHLCRSHGADEGLGLCMPKEPEIGALCEPASLKSLADPRKDFASPAETVSCGASAHCERTRVGFPGGMCSGRCDSSDPEAVCGRIAILDRFNRCLAGRQPFDACLSQHTRPGSLRACSAQKPCREDFICAQSDGSPAGTGACIPPYFLFQMRVDGHP